MQCPLPGHPANTCSNPVFDSLIIEAPRSRLRGNEFLSSAKPMRSQDLDYSSGYFTK
jgi:hypothetical protein